MYHAPEAIERARQYLAAGSTYIAFCELIRAGFDSAAAIALIEHWKNTPPGGASRATEGHPMNTLLTASIVAAEALMIARAFPRDPGDGLFAYQARVDASWETLAKTLDGFSSENLAPAMLTAWDKREPYPDTPLSLPKRAEGALRTYYGFTALTTFGYEAGTAKEIFTVEIRVGEDA